MGELLDAQELLDRFEQEYANPSPDAVATGIDDSLLRPVKRRNGEWISDGKSAGLPDCETWGRRLDLSDEEVVAKLAKGMQAVYNGGMITGDHSEDTMRLLGDIDKITGSSEQVLRMMKYSPRMISAGTDAAGGDRNKKHLGENFDHNLADRRASNDKKFAEWAAKGSLIGPERREQMRLAFERLTSEADPGSLAYKKAKLAELKAAAEREILAEREAKETERATLGVPVASDAYDTTPRFDMDWPPGKTGQLAWACYRTMIYPSRPLAIAWALFTNAQLFQRSFHVRGLGLNMFLMALDETGGGKEKLSETTSQFYTELAKRDPALLVLSQLIGPGAFASEQATYKRMAKHPRQGCIFNEASFLFEELSGSVMTHGAGKKKALLDLRFKSSLGNRLLPMVYADASSDTGICYMPSLSILAEGQPARFYAAGDEQSAADGLYNRFMLWDVSRNYRGPRNKARDYEIGGGRKGEITVIDLYLPLVQYIAKLPHSPEQMPDVVEVKFDGLADALSEKYEATVVDMLSVKRNKTEYELLNRSLPQAWCLAALLAIADWDVTNGVGWANGGGIVISEAHMKWALDVAKRERLALLARFKAQEIGKGDYARIAKLVAVLHDTFKGSSSRLLTTKAKQNGYVSKSWIAETLKGHLVFKEQGYKSATKLLDETISAVVDMGVLNLPPQGKNAEETEQNKEAEKALHGLAGKVYRIDNNALVLEYANLRPAVIA